MSDFAPTPEQRANLTKLADYLVTLPDDYSAFRMSWYFSGYNGLLGHKAVTAAVTAGPNECGSSACAIGHGPHAGIPLKGEISWASYSRRVFGCSAVDGTEGEYMFGGHWPDDHRAAAERIRTVLNGEYPEDWQDCVVEA